jgi:hypothetical protein
MAMKRLLLLALIPALLLAFASAPPAEAREAAPEYGGQASATMSCTDNTATKTRIVRVTITWKNVAAENGGVSEADAQAIETFPADPLASATLPTSPPELKGTAQLSLAFNDTTPFGTVPWQLYYSSHIAPIKAGQLDASNFPGCPYP